MRKLKYISVFLLLINIFLLNVSPVFAIENDEKVIIKAIKNGNLDYVLNWISNNKNVNQEFSNEYSPLFYSIKYNQSEICKALLMSGADPNLLVNEKPALYWAIKYDKWRIGRLLIEFGADIEYRNKNGVTLLMFAAKINRLDLSKIMIDRGGNPFHKCHKGKTAYDYAYIADASYVLEFLESIQNQILYSDTIKSGFDGPYFDWETENEVVMFYHRKVDSTGLTTKKEKTINVNQDTLFINGFWGDENRYHLEKDYKASPVNINTDANIFAVGDVHGEYDKLIILLINNGVIDSNLKWNFKKGHVIFLGDAFDRGGKVTETLWFIYNLEFQARQVGGDVHLLIGNHETMALNGDHRYLHPKYVYFERYFYRPYYDLYNDKSVLGKWLRKQNTVITINETMFLHAGISPEIANLNISIETLNTTIRQYVTDPKSCYKDPISKLIISKYGPLWYRGYSIKNIKKNKIKPQLLDSIFGYYHIKQMIVGHNENYAIQKLFDGKVFAIDVPLDRVGVAPQALLIRNDKFYRSYKNGTKELIE